MQPAIDRAKELLAIARHAAMATVNEDGSPHNTPYRFMIDDALKNVYWGSHPESQHSQNIARAGQVYIVLFESNKGGGLYIEASNAHELSAGELNTAVQVHNDYRTAEGKTPLNIDYYISGPQRMYGARVNQLWVNYSEKSNEGLVERDYRKVITREDLL